MKLSTENFSIFESSLKKWLLQASHAAGKPCEDIQMQIVKVPGFWVLLTQDQNLTLLQISEGVEFQIAQLLKNQKVHLSFERLNHFMAGFIVFHELGHIDLNHFELADSFGIAQRSSMKPKPFSSLPEELRLLAPLCLEMQADHEATEMLLGAYSPDNWQDLREKVLAISGMMMLIELEDTQNGAKGRTHPKAATRIFQLLGHLAEMPLVQAHITQDASLIPPQDELQAFAHDVTVPCFFDAIELAQTAGAASIAANLGTLEDFFKDLEIAKLGDPSRYTNLKTQGARQWAELWPMNEALKQILNSNFLLHKP